MGIKVKESSMIYPAEDTPKTRIWLTSIDLYRSSMSSNFHTHLLCVYPNVNKTIDFMNTSILKKALSRVLVPFYPAAGRFRKQDDGRRLEIDCNGAGAFFIEAEAATHELSDFGDFTPNDELQEVVFATYDKSKLFSEVPLLLVQLTRFKCGGVCLDFGLDHQIADGQSAMHLLTSWARLATKLDLTHLPIHDRSCLAPRQPPLIQFHHSEYDAHVAALPRPLPLGISGEAAHITECKFELCKTQIQTLKEEAISQSKLSYKLSTFEVLAAHVWRCSCKARGLTPDQDVKLYMPIDGRARLKNPSIPEGYFGNVTFYSSCPSKASNIIEKPLWEVANMVHESIKKIENVDYLRSAVDYLETLTGPKSGTRGSRSLCPDLIINSWRVLPFNEIDFGWGPPSIVRHGGIKNEGQAFLIPNTDKDGGMILVIKLFTLHLPLFRSSLFDI